MYVIKRNGRREKMDINQILKQTEPATKDLSNITSDDIIKNMSISLTSDMSTSDIQLLLIKSTLDLVDIDRPDAVYAAARLKLYDLYHKVCNYYSIINKKDTIEDTAYSSVTLQDYLNLGIKKGLLHENFKLYTKEELEELNNYIDPKRDYLYPYAAMEVLTDRYLIKDNEDKHIELIQHLHMSIAMLFASIEEDKVKWAKEFYDIISKLEFINSTPTNSNIRKKNGSSISCLISSIPDTTKGILDGFKEVGIGSSQGSGWGIDFSRLRSLSSPIGDRPNASGGKIPMLKMFNDLALAFDQAGK